jgi:ABC-2 type transport system ATP-binding protein
MTNLVSPITMRSAAAPALTIEHVSKRYVDRSIFGRRGDGASATYALRDVSFTVHEGEVLGLLGPNGAGKTTLLKIISTMLYPDAGAVTLFGYDVLREPDAARRLMGLVTSDERSFYWRLTGRQNLQFFAALYGVPRAVAEERSQELLETLGLADAAGQPFHDYSSGMKQKMAVARGLLADPRLVLYDEPTRALDPLSAQNIRQWIVEKRKRSPKQTHLVATNLMNEAEHLCDRLMIISRGGIVALGTIAEIRQRWASGAISVHRITYRGTLPPGRLRSGIAEGIFDVLRTDTTDEGTTIRVHTDGTGGGLSRVLTAILSAGAQVVRCESEEPTLEEVFCSVVTSPEPHEVVAQ